MALCPVLILVFVLCETAQPYFMAEIIDNGVMVKDFSTVVRIGGFMVVISIIGLVVNIVNVYISSRISIGFGTDLRSVLFDKIQSLSFSDIDKFNSASLITRLTNDISKIQQVILMSLRMLLRSPMMIVMALFFVLKLNAQMALILLISIPVLSLCIYVILKKGFPLFIKVQQKLDSLNAVVRENLINIRVVKSFVREDYETRKFITRSEDLRDMAIKAMNTMVTIFPAMQLITNISLVVILWVGGYKVVDGELKVGELISIVNYLTQIFISLFMMSMVIMSFARASASSVRIVEVLDSQSSLTESSEALLNKHHISRGEVQFRKVSFRYAESDNDVLKNIDFQVHQGETIAVVGGTGSAKTSMVQLIPRLYDATAGEVLVDGVNVKDYSLHELHSKIGMALQKNELFTGTILENLKWGKPDATMDEIIEATRAAQAHDFIMSLTDQYDTLLGRGGVNVSGGQKQRICIARALLRKPKILILDDSTSAVDLETEQKIRTNLHTLLHDTTVFIITQRINTMQDADRVIILEGGEIEAIGRPGELIQHSKLYQEIYYSQQIAF